MTLIPFTHLDENLQKTLNDTINSLFDVNSSQALEHIEQQLPMLEGSEDIAAPYTKYILEGLWYYHKGKIQINDSKYEEGLDNIRTSKKLFEDQSIPDLEFIDNAIYSNEGIFQMGRGNVKAANENFEKAKNLIQSQSRFKNGTNSVELEVTEANMSLNNSIVALQKRDHANAFLYMESAIEMYKKIREKYCPDPGPEHYTFFALENMVSALKYYVKYEMMLGRMDFEFFPTTENKGSRVANKAMEYYSKLDMSDPSLSTNFFMSKTLYYLCECLYIVGFNMNSLLTNSNVVFDALEVKKFVIEGKDAASSIGELGEVFYRTFENIEHQIKNLRLSIATNINKDAIQTQNAELLVYSTSELKKALMSLIAKDRISDAITMYLKHVKSKELWKKMCIVSGQWNREVAEGHAGTESKEKNEQDKNKIIESVSYLIEQI